jgi:hypothetical protein
VEEAVVTSNNKIMVIREIVVVQTITMQVVVDQGVTPTILSEIISVIFVESWDILHFVVGRDLTRTSLGQIRWLTRQPPCTILILHDMLIVLQQITSQMI